MSEHPQPATSPTPIGGGRLPRGVVGLALGGLAGVLSYQLLAAPLAAVAAFVAAGVVAVLAWPVLVPRPTGASLGGAAATGALALVAAYVCAGFLLGGAGAADHDSMVLLIFTFWIVVPVMVAAAVGLALLDRRLGERD